MGSGGRLGKKHAHKVSGKKMIGLSSKERVLEQLNVYKCRENKSK